MPHPITLLTIASSAEESGDLTLNMIPSFVPVVSFELIVMVYVSVISSHLFTPYSPSVIRLPLHVLISTLSPFVSRITAPSSAVENIVVPRAR